MTPVASFSAATAAAAAAVWPLAASATSAIEACAAAREHEAGEETRALRRIIAYLARSAAIRARLRSPPPVGFASSLTQTLVCGAVGRGERTVRHLAPAEQGSLTAPTGHGGAQGAGESGGSSSPEAAMAMARASSPAPRKI